MTAGTPPAAMEQGRGRTRCRAAVSALRSRVSPGPAVQGLAGTDELGLLRAEQRALLGQCQSGVQSPGQGW